MRIIAAVFVIAALAGCSNTDAPEPDPSATTVVQEDVNNFCQDVHDVLEKKDSLDPEDQAERLNDLQEAALNLSAGTRDDMYAADALNECADELQEAINEQAP